MLDVLLDRASATGKAHHKVSAHGMGGLGKTTLAASIVRHHDVRVSFDRLGFVSAGQEPATLAEQRTLYTQLTGSALKTAPEATASSQREEMVKATLGKKLLAVLDDVWEVVHERLLNPFDESNMASAGAKLMVTTRFAKLLQGYVVAASFWLDASGGCRH